MKPSLRLWLFLTGLLLGLGAVGAYLYFSRGAPVPPGDVLPGVVYLSPVRAPEVWRIPLDGGQARQVTESGGKVYDYAVAPGGQEIVYSAANALNGLDLWRQPLAGGSPQHLLDCGADWCSGASFSPDGEKIAYNRRIKAENAAGDAPGVPRLWILDLKQAQNAPLYANAAVGGQAAVWSPDGSRLSFYDPLGSAIRIHAMRAGDDLVLPVSLEAAGGWTQDGAALVFADYAPGAERPVGVLSRVEVLSGKVSPAFSTLDLVDVGTPAFAAGGTWMAVAGQAAGEGSNRSIFVVRGEGPEVLRVASDPQASQGAYHWDRAGSKLVFQEYSQGSSEQPPRVFVWDLATQTKKLIAEDAALPGWIN